MQPRAAGLNDEGTPAGPESLLVAVDGGGSRTRLWLLDPDGRLLGRGEGGSSNLTAAGVEAAARAVAQAARQAGLRMRDPGGDLVDAPRTGPRAGGGGPERRDGPVVVVALALAGADREPEGRQMRARMEELFPGARVVLVHDGVGALLAGTLGAPGLLLLAGTGSLALALGPDGQEVRAGGWGYLLGDEGSGYWIGREAIRVALRAHDGREPATLLTRLVEEAAGIHSPPEVVGPIHRGERDRAWIAGLARGVLRAADSGDEAARRILDQAARELALLVRAVLDRASFLEGVDPVPVVAAGGLFRLGVAWRNRVEAALGREAPRARLIAEVREPVVGAAYLALEAFHGQVPPEALQRLHALRDGGPAGPDVGGSQGTRRFQPV